MKTLEVQGTHLAYVEQGSGLPVVFVHGDLSDYRTWNAQIPAFAPRYRAVAYSRRYHSPNDPIPSGIDNQMATHVDDLSQLLQKLDAAPAHLVGDSWGAFVCLRLAIQAPKLVRSLVLAEPPVLPLLGVSLPPKPRELVGLIMRQPGTAFAFLRFGGKVVGPATAQFRRGELERGMEIFARGVLTPEVFHGLPPSRREQARENVRPLAAALTGEGFACLREADVAAISTPTLLVMGAHTPPLFRRLTDRMETLLPNCRRVTLPNATHSAHEQNVAAYNESVLAFLDELSA